MNPSTLRTLKLPSWLCFLAPAAALLLVACEGCRTPKAPEAGGDAAASASVDPPTLRLYLVSDMAGALEPCGCTRDQLGGMDHFGAFVASERTHAPASAVAAAGPLFFLDPSLRLDHVDQDTAKAHAIAKAFADLGIVGFAPAENDWAAGADALASIAKDTGAPMLLANVSMPNAPWQRWVVKDVGGTKVGFIGVGIAMPGAKMVVDAGAPDAATGLVVSDAGAAEENAADAVKEGVAACKRDGATVFVALASLGRGEAKRLADRVPELTVIVAGEDKMGGEGNREASPPERIGDTLVVQSANHLQTVSVLDLYVRDGKYVFADATGLERERQREELTRRIDDLHIKISNWERDGKVSRADLDARKADLAKMEKDRAALDVAPPPPSGSYFRFFSKEIRQSLGSDEQIDAALAAYYKGVNEHNKIAFAGKRPPSHGPEQAVYLGVNVCATCHESQRKFWDGTKHAHAYATLANQFKEYNLDCVSCHVTGYEQPGGSTVTENALLQNVQCEACHGPGSKHATDPHTPGLITRAPATSTCTGCHHPPHVEQFDPMAKRDEIIGPGHGRPL